MRQYLSLTGIVDATLSTDELMQYYSKGQAGREMIRTQRNVGLFQRVLDHSRVLLREPSISRDEFGKADFINNTTTIFIQSMPDKETFDTYLILSGIESLSSIGMSIYVHTVDKAYVDMLHRTATIDLFLEENP